MAACHPHRSDAGIRRLDSPHDWRARPGRALAKGAGERPRGSHDSDFIAADSRPTDRLSSKLALTAADIGMRGSMAVMRLGPAEEPPAGPAGLEQKRARRPPERALWKAMGRSLIVIGVSLFIGAPGL